MPVAVDIPETASAPPHKLWTRAECEALERAGVLDLDRYELIGGELVLRMGKNQPHMVVQALLYGWLHGLFGTLIALQDPTIDLHPDENATNEPQPDVVVLDRSIRAIAGRPRPEHVLLVAEVSDTTLSFDMTVKAGLYARAGIPEYWVLDLNDRRLIVHRRPASGRYLDVVGYLEEESVSTLAAPAAMVRVGDLF